MTYDADLVVIGSGPAGEKAAAQAGYFGKRVIVVERAAQPGGSIDLRLVRHLLLRRLGGLLPVEDDRRQRRAGRQRRPRILPEGCGRYRASIVPGHGQDAARFAAADRRAERDRPRPQDPQPIDARFRRRVNLDGDGLGVAQRLLERR